MPSKPKPVTADTLVVVTMKGEQHTFALAGGAREIKAWAGSLSDLTGYRPQFIVDLLLERLENNYGYELQTACAGLCPIKFLVTKA